MHFIVYKTTNTVNGKFYVGVHGTENPDIFDGYFGSGDLIHNAIKKYGKENFKRETLVDCEDDEDEAYSVEWLLVKTNKQDPRSYNLEEGGKGNSNLGKTVVALGIGIHAATFEERSEWAKTNQANRDPLERLKMSSNGGKRTAELGKSGFQTCTPEQRFINASNANKTKDRLGIKSVFCDPIFQSENGKKGGKSHLGVKVYNDGENEFKFKSSDPLNTELTSIEFAQFLLENTSFASGRLFHGRDKPSSLIGVKKYHDGIREYAFVSSDLSNKELTTLEFAKFIQDNPIFFAGRLDVVKVAARNQKTVPFKHYTDGIKNFKFKSEENLIEKFDKFLSENIQFRHGQTQVKSVQLKGIRRYTDGLENFIFHAEDKSSNVNIDNEFKEFLSNNPDIKSGVKPKIK